MTPALRTRRPSASRSSTAAIRPGWKRSSWTQGFRSPVTSTTASASGAEDVDDLLGHVTWIFPDRPLTAEIVRVLRAGSVRGCDLWHLANALYLTEQPAELAFVTLDRRQQAVASALGFPTV